MYCSVSFLFWSYNVYINQHASCFKEVTSQWCMWEDEPVGKLNVGGGIKDVV